MENNFLISDQKFLYCIICLLPLIFLLCISEQTLSPLQYCCRQLKQITRRNFKLIQSRSLIAKQGIKIIEIDSLPLGKFCSKMQNMTKNQGSIKGFAVSVPAAGHFFYAHTAPTSCAPLSHPEVTFNFSALGLVALGFTVLPLAGSLPLLLCQFSYSVAISWPCWLQASWLSLGLSSQPGLIQAPWQCQLRTRWVLAFSAFLAPSKVFLFCLVQWEHSCSWDSPCCGDQWFSHQLCSSPALSSHTISSGSIVHQLLSL